MSHITINFLLIVFVVVLSSCASKKRKTDNPSMLSKFRHNTTAYYNGYFNADEILDITYKDLASNHKDNFNNLLPLYPTMHDEVKGFKSELERANDKLIVVANDHEISHWRDDCYVMIGEIQFLLKDYESAEETFEYFMQEFDPLALKNRKLASKTSKEKARKVKSKKRSKKAKSKSKKKKSKKRRKKKRSNKNKDDNKDLKSKESEKIDQIDPKIEESKTSKEGMFKHTPAYNEGMLWMARTYVERGKPTLALSLINRLEERSDLNPDLKPKIKLAKSHYFIMQERDREAISELKTALSLTKNKTQKARYNFVLGQLQLKATSYADASESFDRVMKLKPVYEMVMNAELNQIKCLYHMGEGDVSKVSKRLNKMLKDGKNEEYQSDIYYALGGLHYASNQPLLAVENYNLAIKNSTTPNQKMEPYLALADMNYRSQNYVKAKLYYDSTLTIMDNEEDRYLLTKKKSNSLLDIAKNMEIINLQDSLLRVSRMTVEEKLALAKRIEEEEEKKTLAQQDKSNQSVDLLNDQNQFQLGGFNRLPSGPPSNFFAYNPILVARGKKDFKRKWGNRVLEDNWRLESKKPFSDESIEENEVDENDEIVENEDGKDLIRKYLSGIPNSPKQKQAANDKIEKAMFELGKLYRDKLNSNQNCIETLESLLKRYPNTQYKPTTYYYLHLAYLSINESEMSKSYADRLINDAPESLFAKILSDPDFLDNWLKEQNKLGNYYDKTYALFENGQYKKVKNRVGEVESLFGKDSKYQAKFAMLGAMSDGSLNGKEGYIKSLKDFVAKYPNTPETTRAKEILRFLRGDNSAFSGVDMKGNEDYPQYVYNEDEQHYIIAVFHDMKTSSLSKLKIDVSQYNRKFHKDDKLKISSIDLDLSNSTPVIMIRKYADKKASMDYYKAVVRKMEKFVKEDVHFDVYAISQRNYRQVIKEKSVSTYMKFFELKYLLN